MKYNYLSFIVLFLIIILKEPIMQNINNLMYIRNNNLEISEVAIALSSLVTKILISISKIKDNEDKIIFATAMNIQELNEAITKYSLYNETEDLIKCHKQVRELLQLLYED